MSDGNALAPDWEESDVAPHEAFALLADPNRFDIIGVIAESSRKTLPFNDLYERSNFEDSGQFNYHLDKLVGPFLRKTEEGYQLRHAARIVFRLAVSGLLSDRGAAELTTVESACPDCGADTLRAVYEGDRFWVRCEECDRRATVAPFPPRALRNYDLDRTPAAFDRYTMGSLLRATENVCPWCASPLTATIESAGADWPAVDRVITRTCDHCRGWISTRVHDLLRFHPAVITFYHERGVDILGRTFWAAEDVMRAGSTVSADADGWALVARLTYAGDEIELGIGEELRVSTIEVIAAPTA